jgi:outer membrane lipoprotein
LALALSISGCAYPISQQLRQEAAKNVTFPMVLKNPSAYIGDIVIWGGIIIKTVNLEAQTQIFVLDTPLDYWGEPKDELYSRGRFIAETSEFLDPIVYKKGNKVTLAGEISGEKTLPLGQSRYTYPVVTIKELHLWGKVRYYPYYYPFYYPYYYNYWYGPYWWGSFDGPGFWGFHGYHEDHDQGLGEEQEAERGEEAGEHEGSRHEP